MSGFSKLNDTRQVKEKKESGPIDLSDFSPKASVDRDPHRDQEIADRVARRHNLAEEPISRVPLKRGTVVNDNLFIKGPLTTLNRFRRFCNDLGGVPYHEALALLLDRNDRGGGS